MRCWVAMVAFWRFGVAVCAADAVLGGDGGAHGGAVQGVARLAACRPPVNLQLCGGVDTRYLDELSSDGEAEALVATGDHDPLPGERGAVVDRGNIEEPRVTLALGRLKPLHLPPSTRRGGHTGARAHGPEGRRYTGQQQERASERVPPAVPHIARTRSRNAHRRREDP